MKPEVHPEGYWVRESTEQRMINGRMSTITVRSNNPSDEGLRNLKRFLDKRDREKEEQEKTNGSYI